MILFYANYCFQIVLPYADSDKEVTNKVYKVPKFPLLVDNSHFENYGAYKEFNYKLTSNEKKIAEEHKIILAFDSITKIE